MAKVTVEGAFPKRIDDYILYKLGDQVIIRIKSGFTSKALKKSPKYALSRQNASEFGRVSSTCKALRIALCAYLPKKNNLLVVNSLTKRMRQLLAFDCVSLRGERTLFHAFSNPEGLAALAGYHFNPDAAAAIEYTVLGKTLHVPTSSLFFPDDANAVSFTVVSFEFDFNLKTHTLCEGDKCFFSSATMPLQLDLIVPFLERATGVLLTVLVVEFYNLEDSSYIPVVDDRSKVVLVVNCEKGIKN